MTPFHAYSFLLVASAGIVCTSCSSVVTEKQSLVAPAALDYCTISLTGTKSGQASPVTYTMGENAPMPKLKIFAYKAMGKQAEISFDGVGDSKAVHFNGHMELISCSGNSYVFKLNGEMLGFEGDAKFEATPHTATIKIVPAP
ncbi:MAG: hypothetical protein Q4F38_06200 [Akkermansia sp.]|nr:hypothetical protein [Akkermansia sp.]